MDPDAKYVSEEGLEKLKKELQELKTAKRKDIAMRLEHAKSLGDLSENAEYQEAKEGLSMLEAHISEMEEMVRNAVIIKKNGSSDKVQVGATIHIKSDKGEEYYTIVGSEEASPTEGKISNESPLGRAFLEHKIGDTVQVKTPRGTTKYAILGIS